MRNTCRKRWWPYRAGGRSTKMENSWPEMANLFGRRRDNGPLRSPADISGDCAGCLIHGAEHLAGQLYSQLHKVIHDGVPQLSDPASNGPALAAVMQVLSLGTP